MKFRNTHPFIIGLLLGSMILGAIACKKPKDTQEPEFDQAALLSQVGNALILPNYEDLSIRVGLLESASTDFQASPSVATLGNLQTRFQDAYLDWVHCSTFELGPAAERSFRAHVNTFPTDTSQIQQNIQSGNYDLATASNLDAKGLPALDYLLHGLANSAVGTVDQFNDPVEGPALKSYLNDVVSDLKTMTDEVFQAWQGGYTSTFVQAEGTDVGSSLGKLVNQLNFDYEILKKPRLGIPLGTQTLGTPLPEKVEAVYSEMSLELMRTHFEAISNIYHGKSRAEVDGYGFHEALLALGATYNGGQLADAIAAQINATRSALAAIPGPLASTVVNNPGPAESAYQEVQKLLVLFKTDMSSSLGVLITYVDNDGD